MLKLKGELIGLVFVPSLDDSEEKDIYRLQIKEADRVIEILAMKYQVLRFKDSLFRSIELEVEARVNDGLIFYSLKH